MKVDLMDIPEHDRLLAVIDQCRESAGLRPSPDGPSGDVTNLLHRGDVARQQLRRAVRAMDQVAEAVASLRAGRISAMTAWTAVVDVVDRRDSPAANPGAVSQSQRVLLGDSVYEDATVTINEGHLYVEFEDDDLDSVTVDLHPLRGTVSADAVFAGLLSALEAIRDEERLDASYMRHIAQVALDHAQHRGAV